MVMGRLISGVHWFSDIIGSVILSFGLYFVYKALVLICLRKREKRC
jgi:PAP2 superfamily.